MRTACSSNSILIKYFLEATNHLPPQRKAHCYVLSLKNISWLWGHKYLLISQMHCLVVFGWVRNWLLTIWVSHRLDIPVQWVTWLLEASYQMSMPSISAQTNLERSSQTVLLFFRSDLLFVTYILRNHPTVIYSVPPWQKSGNPLLRPSLQSQNSELRTFQTCPTKSSW